MTRRALPATLALAMLALNAAANSLWHVESGRLVRVDMETGIVESVPTNERVLDVAPLAGGGAWVAAASGLTRLDEALQTEARADIPANQLTNGGAMAADAEGGVWVAVDSRLVRLDRSGARDREIFLDGTARAIAVLGPDALFAATETSLVRIDATGAIAARVAMALLPGHGIVALRGDPLAGYVWLVRTNAAVELEALVGLAPRAVVDAGNSRAAHVDAETGILTLVDERAIRHFDRDAKEILPATVASEPFADLAGIEPAANDTWLWFGDRRGVGVVGLLDGVVRRLGAQSIDRFAAEPMRVELRLHADLASVALEDTSTSLKFGVSVLCDAVPCSPTTGYLRGLRLRTQGGGDELGALFRADVTHASFSGRIPAAPWQLAPPLRAWVIDAWGNRSNDVTVTWPLVPVEQRRHALAAPAIAITAPLNNATYTAPLATTLKATATPGTGASISKVEFFAGATLLGTVTVSPYNLAWSNVQAGTYALTARVTDSLGGVVTSAVVNVIVNAGVRANPLDAWLFNDAWSAAGVAVDAVGLHNAVPAGALAVAMAAAVASKPDTCKAASFAGGAFDVAGLALSTAAAAKTTVAFWMNWSGTDGSTPIGWMTQALTLSGGSLGFGTQNGVVFGIASAGLAGAWHHVVAEFTNGAVASNKLYVDGVPQTLTQRAGTPNNANAVAAAALRIGGVVGSTSGRFAGQLDEVRLYNRALTAVEVSAEFAAANACGTAPTVALTAPFNNATLVAPATVALAATALPTAAGASLAKVEFYNGSTLLAADATSPYGYTWSGAPIGDYALTAKATDSKGTTATSTIVALHVKANVPPTVVLTAPANNSTYTAPATINLLAAAGDADGTVSKVEFYQGATRLATVTTSPYTYTWNNVAAGSYALTAKATDDKGGVTTSAVVSVKVNKPPTVSITAPANNAVFVLPASITISASASDADGTVGKVEFYRDGVLLGADTTSPYTYVWTPTAAGTYALIAKATDNLGAVTTSAAVTVTVAVNQPPTVSITSPVSGAQVVAGSVVTIAASATDADGTVGKVEFYRDGVLLGSDTASPYSFAWTATTEGTYVLSAKATDNKGGTATSPPVNVAVVVNQPPAITLTAPADGQIFVSPAALPSVVLSAAASDPDGTVSAVRFYKQAEGVNGDPAPVLLGAATTAPYQVTWSFVPYTDPPPGGVNVDYYRVWAEASDDRGDVSTSDAATIQVLQTAPPSGITASITAPYSLRAIDPIAFAAPATILLSAASSAGSPPVAAIEFFANGALVATATSPAAYDDQFKSLWRNVAAGTYVVTAKLTDVFGLSSTSNPVTIVVGTPASPSVTLVAPGTEQTVPLIAIGMPQSIAYAASLSDPAGSVARVEFDDNSRWLAWPAAPPYSGTLNSPSDGLHVITARALDASHREVARSAQGYALVGNRKLAAVMTSPAPGATYGSIVPLSVDAVSPDSTITRVDFYSGTTLLGSVTTPPYSLSAAFSSGTQSVYALVQAPLSSSVITVPVSFKVSGAASGASIKLSSPTDGQALYAPANIPLAVTLTDPGHLITRVEYYWSVNINGGLVATATQAPWAAAWTGVGIGEYWLTAVGVYGGGKITSPPVHISVVAPSPMMLTAPSEGALIAPGQSITLTAQATMPGHALSRIEFSADGIVVGSVAVAGGTSSTTVSYSWSGASAGAHSLSARAIATDGYAAAAASVTVYVTDLTVALASPHAGQVYLASADIRIVAGASETAGAIAQVDFYGDGGYLGSRTAAPYSLVWTGVPIGAHTVTAKARDAAGFTVAAAPVDVVVIAASTVTIDAGIDGSSVADDRVSISGTVQAPMNSAVAVNGKGAALDPDGRFFVDNVALLPGTNSLTVALNSLEGSPVSRIITVVSTGRAPFEVTVDPQEGLAPLSATMTITNRGKVTFQRIEIDINDDGKPEQTLTALVNDRAVLALSYPNPGTYKVTITAYGTGNTTIYSARRTVRVYRPAELGIQIVDVYARMVDRLAANDSTRALRFFTGDSQAKYSDVFSALAGTLPSAAAQLGTLVDGVMTEHTAELTIVRDTPEGKQTYMIYLIRGGDGLWRIESM